MMEGRLLLSEEPLVSKNVVQCDNSKHARCKHLSGNVDFVLVSKVTKNEEKRDRRQCFRQCFKYFRKYFSKVEENENKEKKRGEFFKQLRSGNQKLEICSGNFSEVALVRICIHPI